MEYTYLYQSPLGELMLASDGTSLTGVWFRGQKYDAAGLDAEHISMDLPVFRQAEAWLDSYFAGIVPDFLPPLAPKGTAFRKAVWAILLEIPYGRTMTYGEITGRIAEQRGLPGMSAQAVGGAVGHNPISLFIPFHRVIGSDGSLTGYAGGIDRKRYLLQLEGTAWML